MSENDSRSASDREPSMHDTDGPEGPIRTGVIFGVAIFLIGVFELTVSVVRPWASVHPIIGLGAGIFTVLMAGIAAGVSLARWDAKPKGGTSG